MRVFIDASIYIKLFKGEPSKTLLNELEKLVEEESFVLIFPKVTCNEVYRNIKDEVSKDQQKKLTLLSDIFPEAKKLSNFEKIEDGYRKESESQYKRLVKQRADIKRGMVKKLFDIFQAAVDYPDSADLLELAKDRKLKSFPPGKISDPLGDQLVWELLLSNCTDDDLIIVSADGDWKDLTDPGSCNINPVLLKEWKDKENTNKIELVDNLWGFIEKFNKDYKKPQEEVEKDKGITEVPYPSPLWSAYGPVAGTSTIVEPIDLSSAVSPSFISGASGSVVTHTLTTTSCSRCGFIISFRPSFCPSCGFYNNL